MEIYLGTIGAHRGNDTKVSPVLFVENGISSAHHKLYRLSRSKYPESDGWYNHSYTLNEATDAVLEIVRKFAMWL